MCECVCLLAQVKKYLQEEADASNTHGVLKVSAHVLCSTIKWTGIAQSLQRFATGWTVRGSNPGGGEIFLASHGRSWDIPTLLYNGYRVSFPGLKLPGCGVDHPPLSSAEVKERIVLHLYSLPGSSRSAIG